MKNIGLPQSINGIERLTSQAASARDKISNLKMFDEDAEFISLGFNCSTAHYLREIGLRKVAHPFDWVFASPEIIIDACNDSFNAFMDKAQWIQHPNVNAVTHKRYHEYFFTHKDPLNITADFDYYRRACDRFIDSLNSDKQLCFVITPITEPEKRQRWAQGFTQIVKRPSLTGVASVWELIRHLKSLHNNSKFIVVEHYTQRALEASVLDIKKDLVHLRFCAGGESSGKKFIEEYDDHSFKIMLSGLNANLN